jgi:hypothetical protein
MSSTVRLSRLPADLMATLSAFFTSSGLRGKNRQFTANTGLEWVYRLQSDIACDLHLAPSEPWRRICRGLREL